MSTAEQVRQQFKQTAPIQETISHITLQQEKETLMQRGNVENLVMDERTPMRTIGAKMGGSEYVFYIVPPMGFDENHQEHSLVESIFPHGTGGRVFNFKDGTKVILDGIPLTIKEEEILKRRIEKGRKRREKSFKKLHRGF
jgi:hypothetical protein